MQQTIFYSWQSDHPNKTNRGFIETALVQAAKAIRNDDTLDVEPVIDRDTANVPGSPDIAGTIFEKIAAADVFVADVSNVSPEGARRSSPNPNVLIELGYALRALGPGRVILVMNLAYGTIEQLPFDLRGRRIVTYTSLEEAEERATDRRGLAKDLERQIASVIVANDAQPTPTVPLWEQVAESIRTSQPDADYQVRQYMADLVDRMVELAPDLSTDNFQELYRRFLEAIDNAKPLIVEFCKLADKVASVNSEVVAKAMHKRFEDLISRYDLPPRFSGAYKTIDFDYYRFLGYELYGSFVAMLVRYERWEVLGEVLNEDLFPIAKNGTEAVDYNALCRKVELVNRYNDTLNPKKISAMGALIHERHTAGELSTVVNMAAFTEADSILFVRSWLTTTDWVKWRGFSLVYLGGSLPRFLLAAERSQTAEKIAKMLGFDSANDLKAKWSADPPKARKMFDEGRWIDEASIDDYDPTKIGSR